MANSKAGFVGGAGAVQVKRENGETVDFAPARVLEICEMYVDGRDRSKGQREERSEALKFYREQKKAAEAHKAAVQTTGGAHSAGSGGSTRK
jgi:hypothetical protein